MSSVIEICNVALMELASEPISSLAETTTQAVACNTVWDLSRRAVLREHTWNFATKTENLAALASNPRKFRYDYAYPLPSDSLRLIKVYNDRDYKLENNIIYTNEETCEIKYIYDNQFTETWDALFVDAVSAYVQSKIAMAITRDGSKVLFAKQSYKDILITAQAIDASEDIEDQIAEPETGLISSRRS